MSNKETIQKVIEAFDKSDAEAIIANMTEDVEWHMLGDKPIIGKDEMRKSLGDHSDMKILNSIKAHIIVDGDTVAVDGEVTCEGKDGKKMNMYYCDIYELEEGKVKKMISYVVDKKS